MYENGVMQRERRETSSASELFRREGRVGRGGLMLQYLGTQRIKDMLTMTIEKLPDLPQTAKLRRGGKAGAGGADRAGGGGGGGGGGEVWGGSLIGPAEPDEAAKKHNYRKSNTVSVQRCCRPFHLNGCNESQYFVAIKII